MRFDVKKFIFMGLQQDRNKFFSEAQEAGIIDFIDPNNSSKTVVPQDVEDLTKAIKVLRELPTDDQEEMDDYSVSNGIVQQILKDKSILDKLQEERRVIQLEIERVKVFGDFSLHEVKSIENASKRFIQYYVARPSMAEVLGNEPNLIYVGEEFGLNYYVGINESPTQYAGATEMKIERPLGVLQRRYEEIKRESQKTWDHLKTYAKYKNYLHDALIHKLNAYNLVNAEEKVSPQLNDKLFVVQGWVPVTKLNELEKLTTSLDVVSDEIAITEDDRVPTYLQNTGASRIGQDLISIYDTPSHSDADPSMWVLGAFVLFFAFIVGDAGYGAVFLGLAIYLRYRYPDLKGLSKRILNLFTILCVGIIVWGTLTSSFFGMNVDMDSPIKKFSAVQWLATKKTEYHIQHQDKDWQEWVKKYPNLKDVKDPSEFLHLAAKDNGGDKNYEALTQYADQIMLELALVIGIIHVIIGFLRYLRRNWAGLGWILFMIGAYLYFPVYLGVESMLNYIFGLSPETGGMLGIELMIAGLVFAMAVSLIRFKLLGLVEIMIVIQIFADVLSFLRLYALGLSGALFAGVINSVLGNLPLVIAIIVVIAAHAINMLLGIMSGVIHGLRLNFIEWYHYSFEGGGKPFKPLEMIRKE